MVANKGSSFNQALWLSIGQAGSFMLAFVSAAILSRYFDKIEYGTYKQIIYVYTTLQTVFTAGLPGVFSYFLPRLTDNEGKTLVNKITYIFFILGFLFSIVLYCSSGIIADFLKNPELETGLKFFSPFPLLTISTMGVEGIYTALKRTKYIAIYHIVSKLAMLICIVVPVIIWHGGYRMAIIGWGIASLLTFIFAMYMKWKPYVHIKAQSIPSMYRTVFKYSLPLMGAGIIGMFLHSANQFFISRYYGTATFAEFSNGYISLPLIGMICGSVRGVLLPLFSKAATFNNFNEALTSYKNAVLKSVTLLYPIIFFFIFFAKYIIIFLYGKQYAISTPYFQTILIQNLIEVFPFIAILLAMGKSHVYFWINLFGTILLWGIDLVVIFCKLPPLYIAIVSSGIQILMIFTFLGYVYFAKMVNLFSLKMIYHILIVTIHSIIVCGIVLLCEIQIIPNWPILLKIVVCWLLYSGILCLSGKFLRINYTESFTMLLKR